MRARDRSRRLSDRPRGRVRRRDRHRGGGPEDAVDLLGTAPQTTYPIAYPDRPATADPGSLNASLNGSAAWQPLGAGRVGTLTTRSIVAAQLSDGVAKSATRGWRDGTIYQLAAAEDQRRRGFAWAVRLDSRAAATQFEFAMQRFARGQHADDPSDHFRIERVDDDTVVVFAGDEAFVDGASATRAAGGVHVDAPDA